MQGKESVALERLAEVSRENLAISFSGGKDSLVVLDLAYRIGFRKSVFVDTTIEFEETKQFVELAEKLYGLKIDVVKAPLDFFEMVSYVGVPSRRLRWCCDVFKFGPLANYALQNDLDGYITGLRNEESNKRRSYNAIDRNPLLPVKQVNPIIDWTEQDVWGYIKKNELPVNPLYKYFDRLGCWCCPFKSDDELTKIAELFPEKREKFRRTLTDFAIKMNIPDKERFIEKGGWKRWATPLKKISIGAYTPWSPCQDERREDVNLIFSGQSEKQIERIVKILPILTENYYASRTNLRITVKKINKRRLNVLVEKALNCKACGACTSRCKQGALHVDKESIYIDKERCTRCQECLKTHVFRGACIVRNYSSKRASLIRGTLL
jgi:phosphoadenosine phosphosulfate reductase